MASGNMASTTPFYNQWLMSIVISGIGSLPMQVRARGNKAPYICPGGSTASNVQTNAPVSYQVIGPYACQQADHLKFSSSLLFILPLK